MPWTYQQSTGELLLDGVLIGRGYSGNGAGKNAPDQQSVSNVGPLPQGEYEIGAAFNSSHLGPCVMPLIPHPDNEMYGRAGFLIHGDSVQHPGSASHGCIILGPLVRAHIAASAERTLQVVA